MKFEAVLKRRERREEGAFGLEGSAIQRELEYRLDDSRVKRSRSESEKTREES